MPVHKRPLPRRAEPASSRRPVVYISASTPFMSAVKRIRKRLRSGTPGTVPAPKMASLQSRVRALEQGIRRDAAAAAAEADTGSESGSGTVVTVLGTGRAVDKTVRLAGWFEGQGDCVVELRTRTVATVDDVVVEGDGEEEEEDSARVRKMSCLELSIKLK